MIVQTETAVYVIDRLEKKLRRYPRAEAVGWNIAQLRMDGEAIPYIELGNIAIGEPAQFVLQIRDDGVQTIRTTTPVISIGG